MKGMGGGSMGGGSKRGSGKSTPKGLGSLDLGMDMGMEPMMPKKDMMKAMDSGSRKIGKATPKRKM